MSELLLLLILALIFIFTPDSYIGSKYRLSVYLICNNRYRYRPWKTHIGRPLLEMLLKHLSIWSLLTVFRKLNEILCSITEKSLQICYEFLKFLSTTEHMLNHAWYCNQVSNMRDFCIYAFSVHMHNVKNAWKKIRNWFYAS